MYPSKCTEVARGRAVGPLFRGFRIRPRDEWLWHSNSTTPTDSLLYETGCSMLQILEALSCPEKVVEVNFLAAAGDTLDID